MSYWIHADAEAELADAADLSEVTIRRFERADERIEVPTRAAIAAAVGLTFDWQKLCIVPPKGFPVGAIDWEERQIRERASIRERNGDLPATILEGEAQAVPLLPSHPKPPKQKPKLRPAG